MKASFNTRQLETARSLYREDLKEQDRAALIQCFQEDFSSLDAQSQEDMKTELVRQMTHIKEQLERQPQKALLRKDFQLFSLLAKELKVVNPPKLTEKINLKFNQFFEENKSKLVNTTIWIDGEARKIPHINKNGALQLQKKEGKGEKSDFKAITSFAMLKKLGQVNGFPDQNTTNGNKYTLSKKESSLHKLLQGLFDGEKQFLESFNEGKTVGTSPALKEKGDILPVSSNQSGLMVSHSRAPQIIMSGISSQSKKMDPFKHAQDVDFEEIKYGSSVDNILGFKESEHKLYEKLVMHFDDADFGVAFSKYCEEHKLTRKDGKSIPWRGGLDTTAVFVNQAGEEFKLKMLEGGAKYHDDLGAVTEYGLYKLKSSNIPVEVPEPVKGEVPEPVNGEEPKAEYILPKEIDVAISDVFATHDEEAKLYAEEALKSEYSQVSKWNVFKKAKLFLSRGKMRKKFIEEAMKKSGDSLFGDKAEHASDRHSREFQLHMEHIKQQNMISIPEVNQLSRDFIEGKITQEAFQHAFDELSKTNQTLKNALKDISHKGTNILQKLKIERDQYALIDKLSQALDTGADIQQIQNEIEAFLREYQQSPDFLKDIQNDLDEKNLEKLKKYFKHQKAIRNQTLKNLQIKLAVFTGGKSAYQIDNSDREKGWIYKLGHKLDKLPAWAQVGGMVGISALAGLAGGPLGLGIVGTSILTTSTVAGTTGFMNFVKKWAHHTKEQNTHEKNLTHTFSQEQAKMAQWNHDLTLKGAKNRYKRYRAKRQLELYDQTTQKNILTTQEINQNLFAFSTSLRPLTHQAKSVIYACLMQAKARLEAYQKTGHNFLASESPEQVEQDMNTLFKSISLACEKLGISYQDIDHLVLESQGGDEKVSYDQIYQYLFDDYAASTKQFRSQRRWLAGKYGVGSAALSAGMAVGTQWLFDTGMFSTEASRQYADSLKELTTSDQFKLGSHQLANGSHIQNSASDAFSGLSDQGSVVANYGAGTDATALKAGSILASPEAYHAKLDAVRDQIQNLNLTDAQKEVFLNELNTKPWEADWSKAFTNDYLQGDRCAEGLFHLAKGLEASGNQTLIPDLNYDALRSVAGTGLHNAQERAFGVALQLTDKVGQEVAGSGSTWWIPITGFANTFKRTPKSDKTKNQEQEGKSKENSNSGPEFDAASVQGSQDKAGLDGNIQGNKENTDLEESEKLSKWEKIKAGAVSFWLATKAKAGERAKKAKEKYDEKSPGVKESLANGREKTRGVVAKVATTTKAKAGERAKKAKEKYDEKSPEVKESLANGREKTKSTTENAAQATKEKIVALKGKLFDKKEKADGDEEALSVHLEGFDEYPKSKEALAFLENESTVHVSYEGSQHKTIPFKGFVPNQHLKIGDKDVYLTPLLEGRSAVAYIEHNGELVPRIFRKSRSGGNWHAVPGYDEIVVKNNKKIRVSKGEFVPNISYEKGTVVKKEFNQILDNLPDNDIGVNMHEVVNSIYGRIPESANGADSETYQIMPKSAQEFYNETVVFDEWLGQYNPNTTWNKAFGGYRNSDQISEFYDKIDMSQRLDFSDAKIVGEYPSRHQYLGEVNNQIMTAKVKSKNPDFDGREIHITIATAQKDGLSWVENITFPDDAGTSFLTQKNPVSAGLLTTKPLEYETQVPDFVRDDPNLPDHYPYIDIRPLMQNNPLIKQWKKLQ